jgi:hypothetical protein
VLIIGFYDEAVFAPFVKEASRDFVSSCPLSIYCLAQADRGFP